MIIIRFIKFFLLIIFFTACEENVTFSPVGEEENISSPISEDIEINVSQPNIEEKPVPEIIQVPLSVNLISNLNEAILGTQFIFQAESNLKDSTFKWFVDDVEEIGKTDDTFSKYFSEAKTYSIKVKASNINNLEDFETVQVTVQNMFENTPPTITLKINQESGDIDSEFIFTATSDKTDTIFQWYINGVSENEEKSIFNKEFEKSGIYKIEVSGISQNLESDKKKIFITVNTPQIIEEKIPEVIEPEIVLPTEEFEISLDSSKLFDNIGEIFTFYANSNKENTIYKWLIDDEVLESEDSSSLNKVFEKVGNYKIEVLGESNLEKTSDNIFIDIFSDEFNCSEDDTREYLNISDTNNGEAVSRFAISLNSRISAITKEASTVIFFYKKISNYSENYSDKSFYFKDLNGETVAIIQYSESLAQSKFYINYMNFKNINYCESGYFPEVINSEYVDESINIPDGNPSIF